jgi:quinol monooxygenase YgiN
MNPGVTLMPFCNAGPRNATSFSPRCAEIVKPTRTEEDCIDYHLHVSDDHPNQFIFYESWRSKLDLDVHFKTPLLTALFNRRMDLLEKDIDMRFMT